MNQEFLKKNTIDYLLGLTDEPEELIIPPEDAELFARWEEVKKSIPNTDTASIIHHIIEAGIF